MMCNILEVGYKCFNHMFLYNDQSSTGMITFIEYLEKIEKKEY